MVNKSPEKIQKLFNHIAPHYDQNNDIISLYTHRFIKQNVVKNIPELPANPKILDLCTGTGDVARLLKNRFQGANVIGVDFSEEMLKIANRKHKILKFIEADCSNLPFPDNYFDLVTISFGLRNTEDYNNVLSEISRVLKPDGLFVHTDFGNGHKYVDNIFHSIVKFIAEIQGDDSYVYLLESKNEFPPVEDLIELFARHNLKYEMQKDYLKGIISAQYCKKLNIT